MTFNFPKSILDVSRLATPKHFLSIVYLYQHEKKSGYFTDLFWRYGRLKNPAI